MSAGVGSNALALLAAPFAVSEPITTIGDALWLYVALIAHATTSGHVCRARTHLAHDLTVSEDQIDTWLGTLLDARLVSLIAPAPFLVMKLTFWSGSEVSLKEDARENSSSAPPPTSNVPVHSRAIAAFKLSGDGGQGEGAMRRTELADILGSPAEVDALLASVPLPVIRQALRRVALTPPDQIKKSKLALFRYLVAKYNRANHDHAPAHHHHA